jgi:hypothetical protein
MTPSEYTLVKWFHVTFDENEIRWNVSPPGGNAWTASCQWSDIIRVCFKTSESFDTSDEFFIFTNQRAESYLVPTEADGGSELWNEILKRKLFDSELAIKAMSTSDQLFSWPPAS